MIPLGGNGVESQAERLCLAGHEGRDVEIDRLHISSIGADHAQREFFALRELSHGVFEVHFDGDVGDSLVPGVGHSSVNVADRRSDEILGGGHLEVGEFEFRDIRRRSFHDSGRLTKKKSGCQRASDNDDYGDHNDQPAGVVFCGGCGRRLAKRVHEGILGCWKSVVDFLAYSGWCFAPEYESPHCFHDDREASNLAALPW